MSVLFVVFIPVEEFAEETRDDKNQETEEKEGKLDNVESAELECQTKPSDVKETETSHTEPSDGDTIGCDVKKTETMPLLSGEDSTTSKSEEKQNKDLSPPTKPQTQSTACGLQAFPTEDTDHTSLSKAEEGQCQKPGNPQNLPKSTSEVKFKVELVKEDSQLGDLVQNEIKPASSADTATLSDGERDSPGVCFKLTDTVELEREVISVEQVLQSVLSDLDIQTDTWLKSDDNNFWQVTFVVEKEDIDEILDRLSFYGIGHMTNTSVSIFPASYYQCGRDKQTKEDEQLVGTKLHKGDSQEKNDFISSVKSRLTVAQVVEAVKTNSRLTFDFVVMIVLASIIAALGLVENSSVILVASMLVSPLMGPILGVTFGLVIQNKPLFRLGLINEAIGLALCLLVGFVFGLIVSAVNHNGSKWGATTDWPTSEMQARGVLRSLWVGLFVALPSGAGVAFSILGGNVGSLVGVAISASLLPPAVNAGMLWAYGLVSLIKPPEFTSVDLLLLNTNQSDFNASMPLPLPTPPDCGALQDNTYTFTYDCQMAREAFLLGTVSLTLTLLNILCIFAMGVAVLKIKEVAPRTAIADGTDKFWKSDIQVARETYKTLKTTSPSYSEFSTLAKRLAQEEKEKALDVRLSDIVEDYSDSYFQTYQGRLIMKPHLKVDQIFRSDAAGSHYATVGPAAIWRQGGVTTVTEPTTPSTPDRSQHTWMGLRHRHRSEQGQMSMSADVLHPSKNPFKFPHPGAGIGKGKRRLRHSLHRQGESCDSVDQSDDRYQPPTVSSGRFEITTVPEEHRGSLLPTAGKPQTGNSDMATASQKNRQNGRKPGDKTENLIGGKENINDSCETDDLIGDESSVKFIM